MTPAVLFRRLAVAEAITWALLLLGMVLKYLTRTTELGVQVFGMVHGVAFVAYCVAAVFVAVDRRWSLGVTVLALLAAVPPFATLLFERAARRRRLLADAWRLAPGGERPRSPFERAQAWMLARPALAVLAGVAAVAALTGAALLVGPPVPAQG